MSEQNWSRGTSRRTVLKTTAASIAGLSGMGSALISVGRGAEGSLPQPVTDPEPAPAPSIYIGPDLRKFNWPLLLGNERDSMADALLKYVDDATVEQERKRAARESLKDIWSEVEIKSQSKPWHVIEKQREKRKRKRNKKRNEGRKQRKRKGEKSKLKKEGKTTLYTLKGDKSSVNRKLKHIESKVRDSKNAQTASTMESVDSPLTGLSDIIGSGMKQYGKEDKHRVKPMWVPTSTHREISRAAVNNMASEIDPSLADDIGRWSNDPDSFDYDFVSPPSVFHDLFPDNAAQAYAHSYNPDFEPTGDNEGEVLDPGTPLGNAHVFTHRYMNRAEDRTGDEKWKQLGYAMHIIEDLGTPVHTGAWLTGTIANEEVHRKYERAVENSIEDEFIKEVRDLENLHVVPDSAWWDPDSGYMKHAKNIANKTHDYSHDVVTSVVENPENPLDDCKSQTQSSLNLAGMFAMGLIGELTGYT